MPAPAAATDFSLRLRRLIAASMISSRNAWSAVPGNNITAGWLTVANQITAMIAAAQIEAARMGDAYVPTVLEELGIDPAAEAVVNPRSLAVGSSGVDLSTVLRSVPSRALRVASMDGVQAGLQAGGDLLEGIALTQVADAGRLGTSLRMVASRHVSGYVREVSSGACARCLVLAGRWYRWSSGFLRHPRCQCVNVPVDRTQGREMLSSPEEAFRRMTAAQQDRIFTKAGAKAIRDGADVAQVVNARQGIYVAGGNLKATTINARQLGGRARLMPEAIYKLASDREDAIRLLRSYGYLR